MFSGEAYNVEMGITNERFQIERDETPDCQFAQLPNDVTNIDGATGIDTVSAIEKFAFFMRFLDAADAVHDHAGRQCSITEGFNAFVNIGCAQCHTQQLRTGNRPWPRCATRTCGCSPTSRFTTWGRGSRTTSRRARRAGDEFRTAPLWGLGQRVFFLHDGRTNNLLTAIQAHRSNGNGTYPASEANAVINRSMGCRRPRSRTC